MTSLLEAAALCWRDWMQTHTFIICNLSFRAAEEKKETNGESRLGGCGRETRHCAKLKPVWVIPGMNTHPTVCGICTTCPWSTLKCMKSHFFKLCRKHVIGIPNCQKEKRKDDLCWIEIRPQTCSLSTWAVSLDSVFKADLVSVWGLSVKGQYSCFYMIIGHLSGPSRALNTVQLTVLGWLVR